MKNNNADTLDCAVQDLKGIPVILFSMANDISHGSDYVNMHSALSFLAKKLDDISIELERILDSEKEAH